MKHTPFILTVLLLLCLTSLTTTIALATHTSTPSTHLIPNVPYVAQNKKNYCVYADLTMILRHLDFNTTIDQLIFQNGAGYSHTYSTTTRLPREDLYGSMDFLASLYGLTPHPWWTNDNLTNDQRWILFYTMITTNISNDTPVAVGVNPFALPSLRDQYPISDKTWNLLFPEGRHVILLIGYNTTNHTICYNDPNAGYYGNPTFGDHAWMTDTTLRTARDTSEITFAFTYTPTTIPLPPDTMFQTALHRDITLLSGTPPTQQPGLYGINATTRMLHDYTPGTNTSTATILLYKTYGKTSLDYRLNALAHILITRLKPGHPNVFDIILNAVENPFDDIAKDKQHTASYLANSTIQPSQCHNQSQLLFQEADQWNHLADDYTQFLKKGLFLSNIRAQNIMKSMNQCAQDILTIEEELLHTTAT